MTVREDELPARSADRVRKTSLDKDLRKIERLENAGADLIVPDFCRSAELLALLFEPQAVS